MLVEFFAVLVENSKRLADFHLSGGDFSGGMADSGRRLETKRKWGGSGVAKHMVCFYVVCGHLSGCFSGEFRTFALSAKRLPNGITECADGRQAFRPFLHGCMSPWR